MNTAVYKAKLQALQKSVKALIDSGIFRHRLDRVRSVFETYKSIRDALRSSMPDWFPVLASQSIHGQDANATPDGVHREENT
jgi:hypothetical protein